MTIVIEFYYHTKMFNISDFSRYVSPFRFGCIETFYVHLIAPDNKVVISLPLTIVDCEDSDIDQMVNCYFALFHHIKILQDDTFISSITSEYRPITLLISTVDNLSKFPMIYKKIEEVDATLKEGEEDLEHLEEVDGEIDDIRDLIKEAEYTLKELRNNLKEGYSLLRELKQFNDLQDVEEVDDARSIDIEYLELLEEEMEYDIVELEYKIEKAVAHSKEL